MVRKSHGYRHGTRSLLKKSIRERGKLGLSRLLREYEPGEKVIIKIEPSVHKGMPHKRYHGKVGIIREKRGRAYIVEVTQGDAVKEIIVRPEHITPFVGG
ncbi:MAG TPA: 50S ribosomal protein L21e [Candidatus Bathyarchaeota archaeon]|nr:50S ribosomal protein L21e [Candidatus Bathyarchaeota archaeon]HEX68680.1 50S ribosomal protein L21e [Candidatus Bathyarchaeota archaeon]